MGHVIIRTTSGYIIFKSQHTDSRNAITAAIDAGVSLHYADFSHMDLSGGNFDGADFHGATFHGANLTDANLSECRMDNATFTNASLHGACMAFSSIKNCDFTGALWGGTDIAGATIRGCTFDTRSALLLDFGTCDDFGANRFVTPDGIACAMEKKPLVLMGASGVVAFLDHHICTSAIALPYAQWMENYSPATLHGEFLTQLQHRLLAATRPFKCINNHVVTS